MPKFPSVTDRSARLEHNRKRPYTRSQSASGAALEPRAAQAGLPRAESDAVDTLVRLSSRDSIATNRPARRNATLHAMQRRADSTAADALLTLAGAINPAAAAPAPKPAAPSVSPTRAASDAASTLLGIASSGSSPPAAATGDASTLPQPINLAAVSALLSLGSDIVAVAAPAVQAPPAAAVAPQPAAGRSVIVPAPRPRPSYVPAAMHRAHAELLATLRLREPSAAQPQRIVRVPRAAAAATVAISFGTGPRQGITPNENTLSSYERPSAAPPSELARQALRPAILTRLFGVAWNPVPSFTPMIPVG